LTPWSFFFHDFAGLLAGKVGNFKGVKEKECSFLKKRTKKLLLAVADLFPVSTQDIKVFCFFFSKKKTFLP